MRFTPLWAPWVSSALHKPLIQATLARNSDATAAGMTGGRSAKGKQIQRLFLSPNE